jgi:hypothetical protein
MVHLGWFALVSSLVFVSFSYGNAALKADDQKDGVSKFRKRARDFGVSSIYQFPAKGQDLIVENKSWQDAEIFLTYEPKKIKLCKEDEVKRSCSMYLVESIVKKRLSHAIKKEYPFSEVFSEGYHFCPSYLTVQVCCDLLNERDVINFIEDQFDVLFAKGISHEEVISERQKLFQFYSNLLKEEQTEEERYIFLSLEKEFQDLNANFSFQDFLRISRDFLHEIRSDEVAYALYEYFDPSNKVLESISKEDLRDRSDAGAFSQALEDYHQNVFSEILYENIEEKGSGFSSLKRGLSNRVQESIDRYNGLPISENDKKLIRKLVNTLSDKNVFQLLLEKKELEKIGRQIRPVHPLRFLGYICSDAALRSGLASIHSNHFKWTSFVDGFKDKMREEARKGQIAPYIFGFSHEVSVDPNVVAGFLSKGDYEGLIKYFI